MLHCHNRFQLTVYCFCVKDVPGPVVDLKTVHVSKKMISLTWSDPVDNGGSDIMGYVVERKDAKMHIYRQPLETASCKCDIIGLLDGEEYMFRVVARNKFGLGVPVELGPVLAVDPKGNTSSTDLSCIFLLCLNIYVAVMNTGIL